MRGKEVSFDCAVCNAGITPAYAGKSLAVPAAFPLREDHPRLCGEKGFGTPPRERLPGSPPPMRGKAECICNSGEQYGITPAYAGKSALCRHDHSKNKDHPRLCGEKSTWTEQVPMADGSPPPMRGKANSA